MLRSLAETIYQKKLDNAANLRIDLMKADHDFWYENLNEVVSSFIPYSILVIRTEIASFDFMIYKAITTKLRLK